MWGKSNVLNIPGIDRRNMGKLLPLEEIHFPLPADSTLTVTVFESRTHSKGAFLQLGGVTYALLK
jgi:hypothetical protein